MNCASTTAPDDSNASDADDGYFLQRYRCTKNFSVPCVDIVRKHPPRMPAQNVYVFAEFQTKSKTANLLYCSPSDMTVENPPSIFCSNTIAAAAAPPMYMTS